jgi:hypothetical protein
MSGIVTENLGRAYSTGTGRRRDRVETTALDSVSLHVEEGELHGLLGPNGAGKTTLVKILSTVLLPTSGTAAVLGHDVIGDAASVRAKVGMVFGGDLGLYKRLTARQNLRYWAALYRLPDQVLVNIRYGGRVRVETDIPGKNPGKIRFPGCVGRDGYTRLYNGVPIRDGLGHRVAGVAGVHSGDNPPRHLGRGGALPARARPTPRARGWGPFRQLSSSPESTVGVVCDSPRRDLAGRAPRRAPRWTTRSRTAQTRRRTGPPRS